jgi:hypothetical protein
MMKEEYHRTQRLLSEKREELKPSTEKRNERLHYGEGYQKSRDQRYVQEPQQQSGQKQQEKLNRSTGNISARQSAKNLSYSYMNDQADKMKSGAVDLALSLAQHPQSRKGIYSTYV